ncbi:MAG: thiolase family protein [Actinobacteria bacterium]|nr:thiolase family protein [Actinomycetota bacterium]
MSMQSAGGREVTIVEAVRTPIGRGHREKGVYKDTHPNELLGIAQSAAIERAGIQPLQVENVIAGCVQQIGEQSLNIGRNAWLQAGLPIEVPATTLDLQCGSSQHAVNLGSGLIASGANDVVLACGVEHMGHIPFGIGLMHPDETGVPFPQQLLDRYQLVPQGISSEMIAEQWEIPRSELDEMGLRSHQNAARATDEGRFEREIVPVEVGVNGDRQTVATDQGIRPDTSLEALAALKPAFKEDGVTTAGNSSQISDGAAAVLLMAREKAQELGVKPRARIVDQATVGVDPVIMLTGPIPATKLILERNNMTIGDIDLIEINEAFASVVAAWRRELNPDWDRVNVNGGAIALGHPLGSTGSRLITTLLHELERTDKEWGMVTMCCGGGIGTATLIQRV